MKKNTSISNETGKTRTASAPDPSMVEAETQKQTINLVPATMKLKSILVPVDFSPSAQKALHYALSFAEQFGATITVLNVVEPAVYPTELGYIPVEIDALHKTMNTSARERLAQLAQEQIPPRFRANTLVRIGRPYHEITTAARELNVDLIVIATHGYTGLKHVVLGSTAERVVRHAPCPVLTVREREHDFV
jgi:nucleotide-binding universal stress UspA family protein